MFGLLSGEEAIISVMWVGSRRQNSTAIYLDRSGAFVTFCQNVRKLEILTFCENKMADFIRIRHFVLTKGENFSLSDILIERNKST